MYFMAGFDANASMFFVYFFSILLSHYIAVCFSMFAVSISRNFAEAALVGNLWFTLQSMASGYFVQTSNMPVYVRWTRYICYIVSLLPLAISSGNACSRTNTVVRVQRPDQ